MTNYVKYALFKTSQYYLSIHTYYENDFAGLKKEFINNRIYSRGDKNEKFGTNDEVIQGKVKSYQ